MRSIELAYHASVTSGTGIDQFVRVAVVYDKQANATAPTAAQIFQEPDLVHAPRNLENRKRFKILYNRVHQLNSNIEPGGQSQQAKLYRRFNLPVTFNSGNVGDVTDIITGSLYLFVLGNLDSGATDGHVVYYCRIRFTEQ